MRLLFIPHPCSVRSPLFHSELFSFCAYAITKRHIHFSLPPFYFLSPVVSLSLYISRSSNCERDNPKQWHNTTCALRLDRYRAFPERTGEKATQRERAKERKIDWWSFISFLDCYSFFRTCFHISGNMVYNNYTSLMSLDRYECNFVEKLCFEFRKNYSPLFVFFFRKLWAVGWRKKNPSTFSRIFMFRLIFTTYWTTTRFYFFHSRSIIMNGLKKLNYSAFQECNKYCPFFDTLKNQILITQPRKKTICQYFVGILAVLESKCILDDLDDLDSTNITCQCLFVVYTPDKTFTLYRVAKLSHFYYS